MKLLAQFLLIPAFIAALIIIFSTSLFSQTSCNANSSTGGCPNTEGFQGPYDEVDGNFYIRVKYYFIKPSGVNNQWITQETANQSVRNSLNLLNEKFNDKGIYFFPYGEPCAEDATGNLINSDEDEVSEIMLEPNFIPLAGSGIEVFYFYSPNNTPFGFGESIPGTYIQISGFANGTLAIEHNIMLHEMGHVLGLLHTFENNCDDCNGEVSCWCTGDLVEDTQEYIGSTISPFFSCTNPDDPNYSLANNFMSYNLANEECRTDFTNGQFLRMRYHLSQSSIIDEIYYPTIIYPTNSPGNISNNIIVEAGELVINNTIQMLPDAYILVKKGAKLKINGTITGACGKMWRGVIVEGDASDDDQLEANQGKVTITTNGKIEFAQIGVNLEGALVGSGGGILESSGSTFANNTISIRFGEYFGDFSNKSKIVATTFTVNDDYRGNAGDQIIHLDLNAVKGVNIRLSTFKDERVDCINKTIGINAINATFYASLNNVFEDLNIGIKACNLTQSTGSFNLLNCQFRRCNTGIETSSYSRFNAVYNNFIINSRPTCISLQPEMIGVSITGLTNGFDLHNNFFRNGEDELFAGQKIIGAAVTGIMGFDNVIRKNTYENLFWGNLAQGVNKSANDGLHYLCNTHIDEIFSLETANYKVKSNSSIREAQGQRSPTTLGGYLPTGILFAEAIDDFGRFDNQGPQITYYYFNDIEGKEDPEIGGVSGNTGARGVNKPPPATIANENCTDAPPCDPPCDKTTLINAAKTDFFIAKNLKTLKIDSLSQETDSGKIIQLENDINGLSVDMNSLSGKVLKFYSQDTISIKVDSIIRWLINAGTLETSFELARHYYFINNWQAFDELWQSIPANNPLSDSEYIIYGRLDSIFSYFRDTISTMNRFYHLNNPDLQFLESFLNDCDEAAFLSKILLWMNGIEATPECDTIQSRQNLNKQIYRTGLSKVNIVPNPAQDFITIFHPLTETGGSIDLLNLYGKLVRRLPITALHESTVLQLSDLPNGVYFICLRLNGQYFAAKVVKI